MPYGSLLGHLRNLGDHEVVFSKLKLDDLELIMKNKKKSYRRV